jgi:tetratricopeptide (TPR) repeat protein
MDRGFSMLSDSIQLNPYYPWWYNAGLSFYFFQRKEYNEALYWADKMQRQSVIWEMILKSAAYSEMNRVKEAQECLLELKKSLPEFPLRIKPVLSTFLQVDELINGLYSGLEKAEVSYSR